MFVDYLDDHSFQILNFRIDIYRKQKCELGKHKLQRRLTQDWSSTPYVSKFINSVKRGIFVARVVDERERVRNLSNNSYDKKMRSKDDKSSQSKVCSQTVLNSPWVNLPIVQSSHQHQYTPRQISHWDGGEHQESQSWYGKPLSSIPLS